MNIDKDKKIPPDVLILISEEAARYYKMIPLSLNGNVLDVGLVEPEDVQAPVGGGIMVLLSDRPAQPVNLDPGRLLRQLGRSRMLAQEMMHRLEQPHRKTAGGTQPRGARQVRHGADVQV